MEISQSLTQIKLVTNDGKELRVPETIVLLRAGYSVRYVAEVVLQNKLP